MKNCLYLLSAMFITFLICGCDTLFTTAEIDPGFSREKVITIAAPDNQAVDKPIALPSPQADPPKQQSITTPAPVKEEKVKAPVPLKPKAVPPLPPPPVTPAEKPVPPKAAAPARPPERFRHGPGIWRAFTRLSPDEQQKMLELQRKNPELYRTLMQEKVDQLHAQEKAYHQEIDDLTQKIRQTTDAAEKEKLTAQLRNKLKENFMHRLQDTRQDIEAYKRRTAQLEIELQKREKNCEAIIDAILSRQLSEQK